MTRLLLIVTALLFLCFTRSYTAHIIGGDVSAKCISTNISSQNTTFEVAYTMYRDPAGGGALFDDPARFGVFRRPLNAIDAWEHVLTIQADVINVEELVNDDECVQLPPNVRVQKGEYFFNIDLEWGDFVYMIAYQRCCRNNTIINIENPDMTGAAFVLELYGNAISECNNTPKFNSFPPIGICSERTLNYDHSAIDLDGDSIVYKFCTPFTAGGTDGATTPGDPNSCTGVIPNPLICIPPFDLVTYNAPYSEDYQLASNPAIALDQMSGALTALPNAVGQYVIGVCAEEYRNGVLYSKIRRDFQFNVVQCDIQIDTREFELCTGDTIVVNDVLYTSSGLYTQEFMGSNGCDSIINIVIDELVTDSIALSFSLCPNESVVLGGKTYINPGTYIETYINAEGCDSIVTITIIGLQESEGLIETGLCPNDSIIINWVTYKNTGIYEQILKNDQGCDSVLTIEIKQLDNTTETLNYTICDDEVVIVNGITYDFSGVYTQSLTNAAGCDSTLVIRVELGESSAFTKNYSLCYQSEIIVGSEVFDSPGSYRVDLRSDFGCDSTIFVVIHPCDPTITYDFEDCDALVPANSMNYDEFVPAYKEQLACGILQATNIYREQPDSNKHSCTEGFANSIAMCIGASSSLEYEEAIDITPVTFEFDITPDAGTYTSVNHIYFRHRSPENFSWIDGPTGLSNQPTLFGVKIYKNGIEVLRNIDISTDDNWQQYQLDLFDEDFAQDSDSAHYKVELTPYRPEGNGAKVSVWDVDDVTIYLSCNEKIFRNIEISIDNANLHMGKPILSMQTGNIVKHFQPSSLGRFYLNHVSVDNDIALTLSSNDNILHEVTTFDLWTIQQHILGINTFKSIHQFIAADINADHKITVNDLVELRKLILGIYSGFRYQNSWRFVNTEHIDAAASYQDLEDSIEVKKGIENVRVRFTPIKIGDASGQN